MAENVNIYEYLLMLDDTKVSADSAGTVQSVHAIMERYGAEIMASRPWDARRLAYTIRGQKKAYYYLIYTRCDAKNIATIDRDLQLNESVLRFMTVRIEKQLEEAMLALARDEHALALQTAVADDSDYNEMGGGGGGRDRDRGGDRGGFRDRGPRGGGQQAAAPVPAGADAKD